MTDDIGPGWYEVIHPQNATTEIVLVMGDGSIYAPERVITRGEFLYASARGQAHRLIRADDLADHDAQVRAEERERAARIAEGTGSVAVKRAVQDVSHIIAARIRAQGEEKTDD